MTHEEMLEEAAQREALESLGIDYENFGQKPWDESMLAPNGDYIDSFPNVTRVEVITDTGREFVRYQCSNVKVSLQDDGQTIKVFLCSPPMFPAFK